MDHNSRQFINEFPAYKDVHDVPYNLATKQINPVWQERLRAKIDQYLKVLERGYHGDALDWSDYTIYTGAPGISLLYLHLASEYASASCEDNLKKSLQYVEPVLKSLKSRQVTFLCGDAGPLAIASVAYHKLGMQSKCVAALEKLQLLHKVAIDTHGDMPDEILYGRSGYLFSLLFAQKHIAKDCIDSTVIRKIIESIIQSGIKLAKQENCKCPLMYQFYDEHYLGAAHGVSGILFMLMQVAESLTSDEKNNLIKPTIDFLISLKFSSGNYPAVIEDKTDLLVHWCHGAPGFIYTFAMAFQIFGDGKYLQEALSCGDVIWEKGLLKKGYGLCHGTAGNAYAFLLLYKLTNNPEHLYRATKFAEWCFDTEARKCRTPDRPYSLFEGLAGTIYFLVSLLNVENATFPAFQL